MDKPKHNLVDIPTSVPRRVVPVSPKAPLGPGTTFQGTRKQRSARDIKFPLFVYVALILAALVGGYVLFTGPLSTFTHAVVPIAASESASTMFAFPLTIQADGVSQSKIDIFVASKDSLPLQSKKVDVTTTLGSLDKNTATTDNMGHVTFLLTMSEPGISTINFSVDGVPFSRQITVEGE